MTNTQYLKLQSAALRDASLALTPAADTALTIRDCPDGPLEDRSDRRRRHQATLDAMQQDPRGFAEFLGRLNGWMGGINA